MRCATQALQRLSLYALSGLLLTAAGAGCHDSDTSDLYDMSMMGAMQDMMPAVRPMVDMTAGGMSMDMGSGTLDMSMDMGSGTLDMDMSMDMGSTVDMGGAGDMAMADTCTAAMVTGTTYKYATNALLLPAALGGMSYAADLDGSGKLKNQLKVIIQVLAVLGINLQDSLNMEVANGGLVLLSAVQTPDLMSSSCVGYVLNLAAPLAMGSPPPLYDGTDTFTLGSGMSAMLYGGLTGGTVTTLPAKEQTAATEPELGIQISLGGPPMTLTLRGVQLTGTLSVDKATGQPAITNGTINGAISATDILTIISIVATEVTQLINSDPTGSTTKTLIALFENMSNPATMAKCMDTSKCCADSPTTCVILPAEVQASAVGKILAPDVQVFDSSGNWSPVPGGKTPNGMSIGFGFTSIKASF